MLATSLWFEFWLRGRIYSRTYQGSAEKTCLRLVAGALQPYRLLDKLNVRLPGTPAADEVTSWLERCARLARMRRAALDLGVKKSKKEGKAYWALP
jgi:hypothetical protein